MAQPLRPQPGTAPQPKPKVARDRVEVTFDHFAVRTSEGVVTQYPQAAKFKVNDGDLRVLDEDDKVLAFVVGGRWDAVYFPGTTRVMEVYYAKYYDAEGNEIEGPEDDD